MCHALPLIMTEVMGSRRVEVIEEEDGMGELIYGERGRWHCT